MLRQQAIRKANAGEDHFFDYYLKEFPELT